MYDFNSLDSQFDNINSQAGALTSSANTVMVGQSPFSIVLSIALWVFMIFVMWKIFVKAGEEGWKAIIPIYNSVVKFKFLGLNPWLVLLFLIPFVNIAMIIILNVKTAQAFGKNGWFAVGLIFIPYIFYPILAFSDAEFKGPQQ